MQNAAIALVLAAAPDLAALRAKIAIIRAHELESLDAMPRHPLEVLDEDVARLVGSGASLTLPFSPTAAPAAP